MKKPVVSERDKGIGQESLYTNMEVWDLWSKPALRQTPEKSLGWNEGTDLKSEINTTPGVTYYKFWRGFEIQKWKNYIISTAKQAMLQLKVDKVTFLTLPGHTTEKEMPQDISYP